MLRIILASACLSAALISCVSSGKYDDLLAAKNKQRDSLNAIIEDLSRRASNLDANLLDRNRTIEELEASIASLQNKLTTLQTQYDNLKNSSAQEMQGLIAQLEALQDDLTKREQRINEVESKLRARDSTMNALLATLNNALLSFKESGLSVSIQNGKVYVSLSNQLLFRSGSTSIDKRGKEALGELSTVLNSQPDIDVLVEGHTDNAKVISKARFKDNWDLSVLRATEVVRYITTDGGVDPTRVIAAGRSEFFPLMPGEEKDARAANRRTEIILTPKLSELFQIIDN